MDNDETDAPGAGRKPMSLPVLIVGGLAWVAVFGVAGMYFFNRPPAQQEAAGSGTQTSGGVGKAVEPPNTDPKSGADKNEQTNQGDPPDKTPDPVVITTEKDPDADETESMWDPEGIEDFALTDRSGRKVTNKDLRDKPWVTGFIFIRCAGPCPRVTGAMYVLQDELKDYDFQLVTFTVDPEYDTVERLRNYAEQWRADPKRWYFLTGDQPDIYGLIFKSFKMPVQENVGDDRKPGFEVIHSVNLMLVNAEGVVVGKYNALNDGEMVALRRELKKLARKIDVKSGAADKTSDEG